MKYKVICIENFLNFMKGCIYELEYVDHENFTHPELWITYEKGEKTISHNIFNEHFKFL